MARKTLQVDQIVKIYFLRKNENLSYGDIAERTGVLYGTVSSTLNHIKDHWSPKSPAYGHGLRYKKAVRVIKNIIMNEGRKSDNVVEKPVVVVEQPSQKGMDRLVAIESAFSDLQKAVVTFVESEVDYQVGEIKAQNDVLLKEVQELRVLKEEAKSSNVLGELRKHFQTRSA